MGRIHGGFKLKPDLFRDVNGFGLTVEFHFFHFVGDQKN